MYEVLVSAERLFKYIYKNIYLYHIIRKLDIHFKKKIKDLNGSGFKTSIFSEQLRVIYIFLLYKLLF